MEPDDIIHHETARMETYKGLSECFHLPHKELGISLRNLEHQLHILDSKAIGKIAQMRCEFEEKSRLEHLIIDFTRLFIGPYGLKAAPYGSIYLEGERKFMGESALDAMEQYRAAGIVVSDDFKEAPDHIAAELEFMYFLIFKEIETIRLETEGTPEDFLARQQYFLQRHLGMWIEAFSSAVGQNVESDFYQNLAGATAMFIKQDLEYLCSLEVFEKEVNSLRCGR